MILQILTNQMLLSCMTTIVQKMKTKSIKVACIFIMTNQKIKVIDQRKKIITILYSEKNEWIAEALGNHLVIAHFYYPMILFIKNNHISIFLPHSM